MGRQMKENHFYIFILFVWYNKCFICFTNATAVFPQTESKWCMMRRSDRKDLEYCEISIIIFLDLFTIYGIGCSTRVRPLVLVTITTANIMRIFSTFSTIMLMFTHTISVLSIFSLLELGFYFAWKCTHKYSNWVNGINSKLKA